MTNNTPKWLLPVLLPVVVTAAILYYMPNPIGGVVEKIVPDSRKVAISTVIEVNKFIISIAFIIMGFYGSILVGKVPVRKNILNNTFFIVSCTFALMTVYLGHKLYDSLIRHLNDSINDMSNTYLSWIRDVQFFCVLTSAACFLIFIYTNSFKKDEPSIDKPMD